MRYLYLTSLLLLTLSMNVHSQLFGSSNSLTESAIAEPEFLKVDEAFEFSAEQNAQGIKLKWDIADEYYLYKERFKFKINAGNAELGEPSFSNTGKAKQDPYFGEVHVIHHNLEIFLPVKLASNTSDAEIKITYQGCAEAGLCYPPKHQYVLFIPDNTAPESVTTAPSQTRLSQSQPSTDTSFDNADGIFDFIKDSSLFMVIGLFFLLGIGLTFTPCVFPMIPIITSIIAGQEKPTVYKSFVLALSYVLGMALTYAAAGTVTGLLGAGANIQAALQSPVLLCLFAVIFVLLALAMFGFYELQLPAFIRDRLNSTSQKLGGGHLTSVFFIGALSALVVSPCVSAPLAGALLYISTTGDGLLGGLSLFALGLGMGVPLILIAIGGGKWLPKAGAWMDRVKAVFGVMLLAVAIWLLSRFIDTQITMLLWAALALVSGIQMGAFESAQYGWSRTCKALGLLLTLYAALLIIGAAQNNNDPLAPLASSYNLGATQANAKQALAFKTIYELGELKTELNNNQQQISMLDFYADWCISCKVMETQVFPLPQIHNQLKQMNLIKADVTKNNDGNKALLEHFGLFGPPSILFFDTKGNEISKLRIVGEIGPEAFNQRLATALAIQKEQL